MILKFIKNPFPKKWVGIGNIMGRGQQHHPRHQGYPPPVLVTKPPHRAANEVDGDSEGSRRPPRGINSFPSTEGWTKLKYDQWIEKVKVDFPKGTLCTLFAIPYTPKKIPMVFKVVDHNELSNLVEFDFYHNGPKALVLEQQPFTPNGVPSIYSRSPQAVRKLTEEELRLVILQNQQSSTATPAC